MAPVAVALVGLLLQRSMIRFFYAQPVVAMLRTYAIALVIRGSVRGLIGGLPHAVPEPLDGLLRPGRFSVSGGAAPPRLAAVVCSPPGSA